MQPFKVKPTTKKSSTNINSSNSMPFVSEKRLQLSQNNDLINIQQKSSTEHTIGQSMQLGSKNPPTLLRNPSLRPRSGVSRNLGKASKAKQQKSDQEMIQERIKQKLMANTIGERPSTSGMNEISGIRHEKRQKLLNRRTTNSGNNNMTGNGFINNPKTITCTNEQESQRLRHSQQQHYDSQSVSNQQVLSIMLQIIDQSHEYTKLKVSNEEQFTKIRQKLISNVSIIVLKWYKILQDQLFHQVKRLGARKQQQCGEKVSDLKNAEKIPQTIEELVEQEIRRQFSVRNGLFAIEQRCCQQQNKLSMLINGRLERLESLLAQSSGGTVQNCA